MTLSIICPIYKGEKYIENLNKSLIRQKKVDVVEILYIVTYSDEDSSISILDSINAKYKIVTPYDFSHSLTREEAVYESNGDIIVFISQDIEIEDDTFLYKLTKDIGNNVCDASFAKQICNNKTIERYTRMKNYPNKSRVVSKDDIQTLGIMTYFYSDAASAIMRKTFIEVNGYDKKDLLTNEDMYIAYKLINKGYKIKYCADAEVIHSHEYTYKALFHRYFDQGVFLEQNKYISESGASDSALKLLLFVIVTSLKERNFLALFDVVPNFFVRFIANKIGNRYEKLSKEKVLRYTSNKSYWVKNIYNK